VPETAGFLMSLIFSAILLVIFRFFKIIVQVGRQDDFLRYADDFCGSCSLTIKSIGHIYLKLIYMDYADSMYPIGSLF
jgi:hypothetical protein